MGSVRPRSFPRLATPTPHVNVVLYPEQSFPRSKHCVQYGLRRSHFDFLSKHAKQSSAAPVAGALLRRLRGAVASTLLEVGGHATGSEGVDILDDVEMMTIQGQAINKALNDARPAFEDEVKSQQ